MILTDGCSHMREIVMRKTNFGRNKQCGSTEITKIGEIKKVDNFLLAGKSKEASRIILTN